MIKKLKLLLLSVLFLAPSLCLGDAALIGLLRGGGGLGPELVTDGGFDTACGVNWDCETGWSIGSSKASFDGSGDNALYQLRQSGVMTIGKTYRVTFDIVNYTSGRLDILIGSDTRMNINADSVDSFEVQGVCAGNDRIYIEPEGTYFVGSVDNISVKEVF